MDFEARLKAAMWAGDLDALHALAPCGCCCDEHTHAYCPARLWEGCRGGLPYGVSERDVAEDWARFYEKEHGMSAADFFRYDYTEPTRSDRNGEAI